MKIDPAAHFARQAQESVQIARELRDHNRRLTRWTKAADRRAEGIVAHVQNARACNHLSLKWRRQMREVA
jgi:hypothetical protein